MKGDQKNIVAEVATASDGILTLGTRKVLKGGLKHKWKAQGDQFSKHVGRFINGKGKASETWRKRKEERERILVSFNSDNSLLFRDSLNLLL